MPSTAPSAASTAAPVPTAVVTVYRTAPLASATPAAAAAGAPLQLTTPQMVGLVMAVALGVSALGVALALVAYRYRRLHPGGCRRGAGAAAPPVRARDRRRATVAELEAPPREKMQPPELDGAERFELPGELDRGARAERRSWAGSLWRAIRSTSASAAGPG